MTKLRRCSPEIERELHDKEARIRELEARQARALDLLDSIATSGLTPEACEGFARRAIEVLTSPPDSEPQGEVVVTTNERGDAVAVTRQNEEGEILSVIWERDCTPVEGEGGDPEPYWPVDEPAMQGEDDEDEHGGCPPINAYQALGDLRECAEEPGSWLPKWKADRNEQMVRKAMGAKELGADEDPPGGYYLCPKCGEDVCGCDDEQQDAMLERREALFYFEQLIDHCKSDRWSDLRQHKGYNEVRRLLSRTSDEGTGCVVPEGWKLVPVEPTVEMVGAATEAGAPFGVGYLYQLMLAAAPQPGESDENT